MFFCEHKLSFNQNLKKKIKVFSGGNKIEPEEDEEMIKAADSVNFYLTNR